MEDRTGEVFINGYDAFTRYGVYFEESALSNLMTPAPSKDTPEDTSPLIHGKVVDDSNPKVDSRDLSLTMFVSGSSLTAFFANYELFCTEVLEHRAFTLKCSYFPKKLFRLQYKSCQQFNEFSLTGAGKFVLRVTEPNPKNRAIPQE